MSGGNGSIGAASYARAIKSRPPSEIRFTKAKKEKKKMGWLKRKFAQWSREAWENSRSEEVYETDTIRKHDGITGKNSVRFTIYAAQGGHIIEYYKQDRYRDSEGPELVIVNQGDELGKAVEHILTMEALRS